MRKTDCYQVLGVSRYASGETLRRAFRTRLRGVHPDQNPRDVRAAARTRELVEAYHCAKSEVAPASAAHPTPVESRRLTPPSILLRRLKLLAGLLCVLALVASVACSVAQEGASPVYRARLIDQDWLIAAPVIADAAEPSVFELTEWHAALLYNLSFGAQWAAPDALAAASTSPAKQPGSEV